MSREPHVLVPCSFGKCPTGGVLLASGDSRCAILCEHKTIKGCPESNLVLPITLRCIAFDKRLKARKRRPRGTDQSCQRTTEEQSSAWQKLHWHLVRAATATPCHLSKYPHIFQAFRKDQKRNCSFKEFKSANTHGNDKT